MAVLLAACLLNAIAILRCVLLSSCTAYVATLDFLLLLVVVRKLCRILEGWLFDPLSSALDRHACTTASDFRMHRQPAAHCYCIVGKRHILEQAHQLQVVCTDAFIVLLFQSPCFLALCSEPLTPSTLPCSGVVNSVVNNSVVNTPLTWVSLLRYSHCHGHFVPVGASNAIRTCGDVFMLV